MEEKRCAIIGRELEKVADIRAKLVSIHQGLDILCIPFIITRPIPFEIPEFRGTPLFLFTSPRAVEIFFSSTSLPFEAYVGSIGKSTTSTLHELGIEVHYTSSIENAKGMAPELLQFIRSKSQKFHILQPSSNIAGKYLHDFFISNEIDYSSITSYEVIANPELQSQIDALDATPEWVLFYSPSGVRAWVEASGTKPMAFSIGPTTTAQLKRLGWDTIFESESPHKEDILQVISKNY